MAKFNVTAPEPAYGGTVGSVQFTDGKAVIDEDTNPGELAYCRAQGYAVEAVEQPADAESTEEKKAPARRAAVKKGPTE